jgi:hypothetical protein
MAKVIRNGMSATRLAGVTWRQSRHSGQLGNCAETALLDSGEISLRNSRYPSGPALIFSRDEMVAFLAGTKMVSSIQTCELAGSFPALARFRPTPSRRLLTPPDQVFG